MTSNHHNNQKEKKNMQENSENLVKVQGMFKKDK